MSPVSPLVLPVLSLHFLFIFAGPLSERQSVTVALTNTCQNRRMMFKVKTTAPLSYCVRPNGGFIVPGATQNIEGKCLCVSVCVCVCLCAYV